MQGHVRVDHVDLVFRDFLRRMQMLNRYFRERVLSLGAGPRKRMPHICSTVTYFGFRHRPGGKFRLLDQEVLQTVE